MGFRPRARHYRIIVQALVFLLFAALFYALSVERVPGPVASLLLAVDPLTAVGTAFADWTIAGWTWLGLIVLAATFVLGRFFCGWICPLGTLQHLASWIAGPERRKLNKINRYRRWFALKYIVLTVVLSWAVVGANHAGWLDPIPLVHRAVAGGLRPLWFGGTTPGGWFSFGMLAAIVLLSTWMPRFYCRAACPLGALLGLAARLAPLRIRRTGEGDCSGCTLCLMACQGADEPLAQHRVSECHVCLNCLDSCADESLRFGLPSADPSLATPPLDVGRRRFLITAVGTAAIAPIVRATSGGESSFADAIRPPGALDEDAFLARCITCGACSASCPTNVITSDLGTTGVEGLFTPVLDMRRGWCEPSCIRCGEVCPTDALATLTPDVKQAIGGPAEIRIGTAFLDRGRCLPWAMATPCIVCEEMCPTSPKAIWLESTEVRARDGRVVAVQQPFVDPELCTGCGLCENRCPVGEEAAIRVFSVGETRDPDNRMLTPTIKQ